MYESYDAAVTRTFKSVCFPSQKEELRIVRFRFPPRSSEDICLEMERAFCIVMLNMTFFAAITASIKEHVVAGFVENLSVLSGKGNTEVNYITDLGTFEEREVPQK